MIRRGVDVSSRRALAATPSLKLHMSLGWEGVPSQPSATPGLLSYTVGGGMVRVSPGGSMGCEGFPSLVLPPDDELLARGVTALACGLTTGLALGVIRGVSLELTPVLLPAFGDSPPGAGDGALRPIGDSLRLAGPSPPPLPSSPAPQLPQPQPSALAAA